MGLWDTMHIIRIFTFGKFMCMGAYELGQGFVGLIPVFTKKSSVRENYCMPSVSP